VFQHQDPTLMTRAIAEIVHSEANLGNTVSRIVEKSETVLAGPQLHPNARRVDSE